MTVKMALNLSQIYLFFSNKGHYNCLWLQKRTPNVLELQFGRRPSTVASLDLCDNANFWSKTWTTLSSKQKQKCPLAGQYSGQLIDNPELCAKLFSDCDKNDAKMNFQISPCSQPRYYS